MDQIIHNPNEIPSGLVTPDSPVFTSLLAIFASGASERDRNRIHPFDAISLIRRTRIGALRLARPDGGAGLSARDFFHTIVRLGEADPNVAHSLRNHFSFVERFARLDVAPQSAQWRAAVARGEIFGLAFGELDAPQVGAKSFSTMFRTTPDGFAISGTKYYSTGSLYADHILTRGVFDDGELGFAVLPVGREGIELVDDWDGFGQRVTGSGTTYLRDVPASADEVVRDADIPTLSSPYAGIVPQLVLTAILAGIIASIATDASGLLRRRSRSYAHATTERPPEDPLLQVTVGQIASNAFAAEAIILAAADAIDRIDEARMSAPERVEDLTHAGSLAASKAKVVVDDLAIRSGSLIFDVGGASAAKSSANLDRHWRNARTLASHNPSSYKARAIGDWVINGKPLPATGFF
jgi:alkylation response protein AidB-like acyl-CoA dehydrogenase